MLRRLFLLPLLIAVAVGSGCSDDEATDNGASSTSGVGVKAIPHEHVDAILTHFNRGVGLMDRFQPVEAIKEFEAVVGLAPEWVPGRLNLGIALLNAQSDVYYVRAEKELARVRRHHPAPQ